VKNIKFFIFLSLVIIFLSSKCHSYEKIIDPPGNLEEIVDLIFQELQQKNSLKWALSPRDIFLQKFYLVPESKYLQTIYCLEIKYPLKSIWHQTFLEYNLRFLLADQTNTLIEIQEELRKKKEIEEKARKILGKYYQEIFKKKQKESKIELTNNLNLIDIIANKEKSENSIGKKFITIDYTKHLNSLRKKEELVKEKKIKYKEEKENYESEATFITKAISVIFKTMDWLEKNKEIIIILYTFILFTWIIVSSGKK